MSYSIRPVFKEAWERAIYFIAFNDDPDCLNYREICGYISTICIAETFRVHTQKVARAVLRLRRRANLQKRGVV